MNTMVCTRSEARAEPVFVSITHSAFSLTATTSDFPANVPHLPFRKKEFYEARIANHPKQFDSPKKGTTCRNDADRTVFQKERDSHLQALTELKGQVGSDSLDGISSKPHPFNSSDGAATPSLP
jgi:hypothetical protein